MKIFNEQGKLIESKKDGELVIRPQDLRDELAEANGNPQVISVLDSIIEYIEAQEKL